MNHKLLHRSVVDFLAIHNGWMPDKALFDYTDLLGALNSGEVLEFLPLNRSDHDDIAHVTSSYQHDGRICLRFLVVARESGGHLVLVDNETGHVFLWDHDQEEHSPKNVYLLANSLQDFLDKMLYDFD